jgi:hypothetical protein
LIEQTISLEPQEAYASLKARLLNKGCRVIADEAPNRLSVIQGSIWGISPKTAKKMISYRFSSVDSGTRITVSSKLTPDWKNITLIGSAFSLIMTFICLWIASDMDGLMTTQKPSYWSWIVITDGYANLQLARAVATLTQFLAVFLAVVVVLEINIFFYVNSKIDNVAKDSLKLSLKYGLNQAVVV